MRLRALITIGVALITVTPTQMARAHGDISETDPAAGSTQRKIPKSVSVTFTERPTQGASEIVVRDGCKRNVASDVSLSGHTMNAAIQEASPGHWRVKYRILSADDGHPSRGGFSLHVRGKRDCNEDPPTEQEPSDDESNEAAGPLDDSSGSQEESFPWLAIGGGTLALILVALVLRQRLG